MAAGVRAGEELVDFRDRQNFRQPAAAARALDDGGRILAAMTFRVEKPVELAQCG